MAKISKKITSYKVFEKTCINVNESSSIRNLLKSYIEKKFNSSEELASKFINFFFKFERNSENIPEGSINQLKDEKYPES